MKVVHVIQSPGFAGVERHVIRLAVAQAARGDDVTVIGGDRRQMTDEARGAVELRRGDTAVQVAVQLVRCLRTAPDIVHANMTVAEGIAALVLQGRRVPLVATRHFARPRGRTASRRVVSEAVARRQDAQIAISQYVADRIQGSSVVVHPGVDVCADGPSASARSRVVLVAQRLEPEKETDVAVHTFARSGLAGAGWRLALAGDGAERAGLVALVEDLGLTGVTDFLGHRPDVTDLMATAGVLLAPCRVEGLGLTVLEAMAAGLPVVAVGAGGHLETVASVPGAVLHAPGDATGAGELLRALALDDGRRDRYAAALQEAQRRRFTPEHQASATARVYEGLL